MTTLQDSILFQETGQDNLIHPSIIEKPIFDLSGFQIESEFYLTKDIDGWPMAKRLIAKSSLNYRFTESEDFKGVEFTTDYYTVFGINAEDERIILDEPVVCYTIESSEYHSIVSLETLTQNARKAQILVLMGTVRNTPFEANVSEIVNWYKSELDLFITYGFSNFKDALIAETDPDRLAVLDEVPLPDILPGVTAKTNILNRLNAYEAFVAEHS